MIVRVVLAGYPRLRYGTLTFEHGRLIARNDAGNVLVDATPALWRELILRGFATLETVRI